MISTKTEYVPDFDEPSISLRELHAMLGEVNTLADLRTARRFLALIVDQGLDPQEAWKAMGLDRKHGPYDPDDAKPVSRLFRGRARGLFDR